MGRGDVKNDFAKTRKDLRKETRIGKKARKREFFSRNKRNKRAKTDGDELPKEVIPIKKVPVEPDDRTVARREAAEKKVNKINQIRRNQLLKANEEEDKVIKKLEKQLKIKKKKSGAIPKTFQLDGLNYLLEVCDKAASSEADKRPAEDSGSEFEEDFFIAAGKKSATDLKKKAKDIKKNLHNSDYDSEQSYDDEENDEFGDDIFDSNNEGSERSDAEESDNDRLKKKEGKKSKGNTQNSKKVGLKREIDADSEFNKRRKKDEENMDSESDPGSFDGADDDEIGDEDELGSESNNSFFNDSKIQDDNEIGSDSDVSSSNDKKVNDDEKKEVWEDIYGRKRDKEGNVITDETQKYVPPSLRRENENNESKEDVQVKRQIKSLLNKLTGSNMHWTSSNMEKIYSSYSRYSVNNSFCSLWMDSIVKTITTFDRMAVEHALLVAILHANVGTEVGAYFLQNFAIKFTELMSGNQELENKSLDNLILGICHLYNFKIFHSALLYDILNRLTENLTEKTIECVLIAFRTMGSTLRKDDPSGLKTFIQNAQQNTKYLKESPNSARADFLIDILLAIKNNNLNKIPNYDPTYLDEMKKSIKGIIRKGNRIVSLNISLKDLCQAKDKGKWWIVGSAWEGDLKQEKAVVNNKEENENTAHLLRIADSQRINTDLRKNIFVIIMSAEDYLDAFEKLLCLNLSAQQEREIVNVLISCCMQEKSYNAYYSVLAQKFCDYDRKYQLSLQYSAWDKIKDLESCQMFQIVNLARLLSHLFIQKGLSISVLKVIEFADLNKQSMRFMRQILIGILLHKNQQLCFDVFQRVAPSPKLRMFRESLRLFISHFLMKNLTNGNKALNDDEIATLKDRCANVDRILHSDSRVEF